MCEVSLLDVVVSAMNLWLKRVVNLCLTTALIYFTLKSRETLAVPDIFLPGFTELMNLYLDGLMMRNM